MEIIKDGHRSQDSQGSPKSIDSHSFSLIPVQETLIYKVSVKIGKSGIQLGIMWMPLLMFTKRTSRCFLTSINNFQI